MPKYTNSSPHLHPFFIAVGYFNYRYFINFLLYVFVGMCYGTCITYRLFLNSRGSIYRQNISMSNNQGFHTVQHLIPLVPTPKEKTVVSFAFMLCLSVGLAVFCLLALHTFLTFTGQTTIEFHANSSKKRIALKHGRTWINPYDLGAKRNWQQVYGTSNPLIALLPSMREPEFLPVAMADKKGRRHPKSSNSSLSHSVDVKHDHDINMIPRNSGVPQHGEQVPFMV